MKNNIPNLVQLPDYMKLPDYNTLPNYIKLNPLKIQQVRVINTKIPNNKPKIWTSIEPFHHDCHKQ